ncbi:ABC transporter substrate-binding protein, partial [Aeromicrobium alkaliterrae]|uniref:ABC transporter substrate-binding protein n=1 Tax=Aeromicrobium alkaliterrae TaxID=302168 RepID=UPI0031DE46BE
MTLRIGAHHNSPTLDVFARSLELQQPLIDAGIDYQIVWCFDGVETVEMFRIGALDVSGGASQPPVAMMAHGVDVVFLATSAPRDGRYGGGLVVRADSGINSVQDLRGRSVANIFGSWHTTALAFSLDTAGLAWSDVVAVDLSVASARQAFRNGDLDAWIIDEPTISKVRQEVDVNILVKTSDILSHPSIIWSTRAALDQDPDAVRVLLEALDDTDRWISAHPEEAADLVVSGTTRSREDALAIL